MGIRTRATSGHADLYVLFRGISIAVAATEGSGLNAGWYEASNAAITSAGLPAGTYDGAFLHGNPASPHASDAEEAVFFDAEWTGTVTADSTLTPQDVRDAMKLAPTAGSSASGSIDDKLNDVQGGNSSPVSQIPVPLSRTWIVKQTDNGLAGELPIIRHVGELNQIFAIDFRNDLAVNGRVVSIDSVTVLSGTEGGITFSDEGRGVDRSQAKLTISLNAADTYVIQLNAMYDHGDGVALVTLIVR